MQLTEKQLEQIRAQVRRVKACGNPFYTERFKNVNPALSRKEPVLQRISDL